MEWIRVKEEGKIWIKLNKKLRSEMDYIRILLGIDFNLENLLYPDLTPKEQAVITSYREAADRVTCYK